MSRHLVVSLVITSEALDVATIERLVGVQATRSWRLGERIGASVLTRKHHGWVLNSGGSPQASLAQHVETLLTRIGRDGWESVRSSGQCEMELACEVKYIDDAPVLSLPVMLLARVAEVGAGIDIDIIPG